jgi:Tetratricopeptide repeat
LVCLEGLARWLLNAGGGAVRPRDGDADRGRRRGGERGDCLVGVVVGGGGGRGPGERGAVGVVEAEQFPSGVQNAGSNLASCYRDRGDLPRIIALHQQSAADCAGVLGDGHSEAVSARSNLAYAYQQAGDLDRAIPSTGKSLADRERLYGPDHHFTEIARHLLTTAHEQASGHERTQGSGDR